ncbi:MAG: hypothetical protein HQ538_04725 [Parcubacteria group bacterium]|nr:hypothetical protein [Parcubacteria group bacterium]
MKKVLTPYFLGLFLAIGSMFLISYEEDISYIFFNSYDTNIPSYIIIGFFAVIIIAIVLMTTMTDMFGFFKSNKNKKKLFSQGRDAQARVISLDEASDGTVTTINEQPLVTLKLEVQDGSKPPYEVILETVIARLDIPRLQPGNVVKIKIDQNDPNNIVLA